MHSLQSNCSPGEGGTYQHAGNLSLGSQGPSEVEFPSKRRWRQLDERRGKQKSWIAFVSHSDSFCVCDPEAPQWMDPYSKYTCRRLIGLVLLLSTGCCLCYQSSGSSFSSHIYLSFEKLHFLDFISLTSAFFKKIFYTFIFHVWALDF